MDRNEVYTLGAVAVTIGFSLSTPSDAVAVCSAMIPIALTYIARLRYVGIGIMVRSLNNFMVQKEASNRSISWNSYQREAGAGAKLRSNRFLFWRVLMFGSAAFLLIRVFIITDKYLHLTAKLFAH
jgi:hypothetical protein